MRNALMLLLLWICSYAIASSRFERYTDPADIVLTGTLPWVVYVSETAGTFSAVLVSNRYLITSAHALDQFPDADCLKVNFKNAKHPFSVKVKRFLIYPQFDVSIAQHLANDFAIIELDHGLNLQEQEIDLPIIDFNEYSISELTSINPVYAAGYADSPTLKKVELMWSLASTTRLYKLSYSGDGEPGDSGAPLFYSKNNSFYLLGIHDSGGNKAGDLINFEPVAKYFYFISNNTDIPLNNENKSSNLGDWSYVKCCFDTDTDTDTDICIGIGIGIGIGIIVSVGAGLTIYMIYRKNKH